MMNLQGAVGALGLTRAYSAGLSTADAGLQRQTTLQAAAAAERAAASPAASWERAAARHGFAAAPPRTPAGAATPAAAPRAALFKFSPLSMTVRRVSPASSASGHTPGGAIPAARSDAALQGGGAAAAERVLFETAPAKGPDCSRSFARQVLPPASKALPRPSPQHSPTPSLVRTVLREDPTLRAAYVDGPWRRPLEKALAAASLPLAPPPAPPFLSDAADIHAAVSALRADAATTAQFLQGAQAALEEICRKYEAYAYVNATTPLHRQLDTDALAKRLRLGVLHSPDAPSSAPGHAEFGDRSEPFGTLPRAHTQGAADAGKSPETTPASSVWQQAASQWQEANSQWHLASRWSRPRHDDEAPDAADLDGALFDPPTPLLTPSNGAWAGAELLSPESLPLASTLGSPFRLGPRESTTTTHLPHEAPTAARQPSRAFLAAAPSTRRSGAWTTPRGDAATRSLYAIDPTVRLNRPHPDEAAGEREKRALAARSHTAAQQGGEPEANDRRASEWGASGVRSAQSYARLATPSPSLRGESARRHATFAGGADAVPWATAPTRSSLVRDAPRGAPLITSLSLRGGTPPAAGAAAGLSRSWSTRSRAETVLGVHGSPDLFQTRRSATAAAVHVRRLSGPYDPSPLRLSAGSDAATRSQPLRRAAASERVALRPHLATAERPSAAFEHERPDAQGWSASSLRRGEGRASAGRGSAAPEGPSSPGGGASAPGRHAGDRSSPPRRGAGDARSAYATAPARSPARTSFQLGQLTGSARSLFHAGRSLLRPGLTAAADAAVAHDDAALRSSHAGGRRSSQLLRGVEPRRSLSAGRRRGESPERELPGGEAPRRLDSLSSALVDGGATPPPPPPPRAWGQARDGAAPSVTLHTLAAAARVTERYAQYSQSSNDPESTPASLAWSQSHRAAQQQHTPPDGGDGPSRRATWAGSRHGPSRDGGGAALRQSANLLSAARSDRDDTADVNIGSPHKAHRAAVAPLKTTLPDGHLSRLGGGSTLGRFPPTRSPLAASSPELPSPSPRLRSAQSPLAASRAITVRDDGGGVINVSAAAPLYIRVAPSGAAAAASDGSS